MNYFINENSTVPAYIQIYQFLKDDIVNEAYPFGSKMPSKRTLSADTGVSVITIKHAMELLCDEGYTEARERSGYFVIFRKKDFFSVSNVAETERQKTVVVPVEGAFPYTVLSRTMRKVITDYAERILIKSPNRGCMELRSEICAYLIRSRGLSVNPSQVVIGSGAEYLYGLIAQLIDRNSIVAIENPSYVMIKKVYESFGMKCDELPLLPDGLSTKDLEQTKATVLHITPFNSFPSNITVGISKKHEYLKWARERNALIIEDNYDSELTVSRKQEDTLFSISDGKGVIYVNTFSKTIAPSIRVGYMIIPEEMVELFNEKLGFYSCTVPVFDQYVLAELLHSGDFERHLNRIRRKKRKELSKQ